MQFRCTWVSYKLVRKSTLRIISEITTCSCWQLKVFFLSHRGLPPPPAQVEWFVHSFLYHVLHPNLEHNVCNACRAMCFAELCFKTAKILFMLKNCECYRAKIWISWKSLLNAAVSLCNYVQLALIVLRSLLESYLLDLQEDTAEYFPHYCHNVLIELGLISHIDLLMLDKNNLFKYK